MRERTAGSTISTATFSVSSSEEAVTSMSSKQIQVIDLFAGPGGLGEGFASYDAQGVCFRTIVSAEMDAAAHSTLCLRAFYRLACRQDGEARADYYRWCNGLSDRLLRTHEARALWQEAEQEARRITLGSEAGNAELDQALKARRDARMPLVLIGGPPCQAYSLVGRARNKGKANYRAAEDHRHFLYQEYLRIIRQQQPDVFVMENVKGILSASVDGQHIFSSILRDLADPGCALDGDKGSRRYRICSLVSDSSHGAGDDYDHASAAGYVIRAEQFGIPQARHRVILLGIAEDVHARLPKDLSLQIRQQKQTTVADAIRSLPELRSRISRGADSTEQWLDVLRKGLERLRHDAPEELQQSCLDTLALLRRAPRSTGGMHVSGYSPVSSSSPRLAEWYGDANLHVWLNHEARGHMHSDLYRYLYAAIFADAHGRSPKGHQEFNLPGLAPEHRNWESGKFSDRFRVQPYEQPSTTVTSHISKDGHYFIHPDPLQCRSLTVREAARLQTFPDNYFFRGNRTEQYHQVGNAVPPLLAHQIAEVIGRIIRNT